MSIFMSQSPVDNNLVKPYLYKPFSPLEGIKEVCIVLMPRESLLDASYSTQNYSTHCVPNSEEELSKFVQTHCADGQYIAGYIPGREQHRIGIRTP